MSLRYATKIYKNNQEYSTNMDAKKKNKLGFKSLN